MPDITREQAWEIVTNALDDLVSGPSTKDILEALGVSAKVPHLPKKAVLDLNAERLFIDGVEFPWYITEDGVDVASLLDSNAIPTLSFTMFAETIEVMPKKTTTEK